MHQLILFGEVKVEIDSLLVLDLKLFLLMIMIIFGTPATTTPTASTTAASMLIVVIFLEGIEGKESISCEATLLASSIGRLYFMFNCHMRFQLCLCPECHVAFQFALFEWTYVVSPSKMSLQGCVIFIIYGLIVIRTKVALQMITIQMINELQVIEEMLLAKVTPRVGEDLCLTLSPGVSIIDMIL